MVRTDVANDSSKRRDLRSPVPHPNSPAGRTFDWSRFGVPHPDSPAGGAFDWSSLGIPHPHSPAGQSGDWGTALLHNANDEQEDLGRQIEDLQRFLAEQSAIFREKLPDSSIRDIYDRQTKTSGLGSSVDRAPRGTGRHLSSVLQILEKQIQLVDAGSRTASHENELRRILGAKSIAWESGPVEQNKELLEELWRLAERFYDTAARTIQKQWAEAKRTGKQAELLERWKRPIVQHRADSGSGSGRTQSDVEEQQQYKGGPKPPTVEKKKVTVTINLSQPVACPGHPLAIWGGPLG